MFGSGVDGGRIMPWGCGTMYLELVRKRVFFFLVLFFYNNNMLVKVMGVMIILRVHTFTRVVVVSIGPYSCALCRIWVAYAYCGLSDAM